MKVLIVDDNADDRRLLRHIIGRKGHEAIEAEDGLAGLRMAKINKPDLIISDALMPLMDGFQFLRQVKEDEVLKSIPFIFYSAIYKADRDVDLALALGAEGYIIKPKEPSELWEEVEIILRNGATEKVITPELIKEDEDYLKRYSQVVAEKLEEKIRELEAAKTKVEESESFIRNILESVDEGFIVVDPDYKIISANRAFCGQVKSTSRDVIGRHCYEVSHHLDRPCLFEGIECPTMNTFRTGIPSVALHTHYDKDGSTVYVENKSYPIRNASGEVTAVIETLNNISEKRRLEEQLRHAQKMEAIGTLAGGIAHDFNNMLNVILGYGALMQMEMKEADHLLPNLKEILKAGEKAAELTKGLLLFSRKQELELKPLDINEVVDEFKKMLGRIIGEDIELRIKTHEMPLTVMADRGHLEQVLMNLASNARDAMHKGGILSIEMKPVSLDGAFIKVHGYGEPGDYALISVSDTGHGIDESTRERIFEPYFTTKGIGKGTGLGLSIVFGIIRQHKGYINCYSEPDKGTTFKIYIPLAKVEGIEVALAEAAAPARGTETLLVAEDDPAVRNLTRITLENYGYTVIEAADGEDAVEKFRENEDRINLVLLDVIMPKKNGKDSYEEIKDIRSDVRAILMSGYNTDLVRSKGFIENGLAFISKPVSPNELLRKIRAVLDK